MNRLLFLFSFLLSTQTFGQQSNTYIYNANGEVIAGTHIRSRPETPITLIDSATNNSYELDSMHIIIRAFDSKKNLLWSTDPWLDSKLEAYRTKRPVIVHFTLGKNEEDISDCGMRFNKGETVIFIGYNNSQFGFIRLSDGFFFWEGQD